MNNIFHITTNKKWQKALIDKEYRDDSLSIDGFIHCSTSEQIIKIANAFYQRQPDLVVLFIDINKLTSPLKWEAPIHIQSENLPPVEDTELFPHIYGAINLDSVVNTVPLIADGDGLFTRFER